MARCQRSSRHKPWLHRNRIDGFDVCRTVRLMKQIRIKEEPGSTASIQCQHCGGATRLIGSEPHPVQDNIDLLTYVCTVCDEFLVLPENQVSGSGVNVIN